MLPAIRALAEVLGGRLHLIAHSDAFDLFFSDIRLRSISRIKQVWKIAGEVTYDVDEIVSTITGCDTFFCFNRSLTQTTKKLIDVLNPTCTVGFFREFNSYIPFTRTIHAADLAFRIPLTLDGRIRLESYVAPPRLPKIAIDIVAELLAKIPRDAKLLAIHNETAPEKTWPHQALSSAVGEFLSRNRQFVALMIERDVSRDRNAMPSVISAAGLPLPISLAIVSRADLFLGVDSCMLHMADLSGVPGVGLFGPTRSEEFGYRFTPGRHISECGTLNTISGTAVVSTLESLAVAISSQ